MARLDVLIDFPIIKFQCTFYTCDDEEDGDGDAPQNRFHNLTEAVQVDHCYYFSWRTDIVYMEEPNPFKWYSSAGFHSVFWPALIGVILLIVLIVRKLFKIAKNSAKAAENSVPPTFVPNLYVVGSESAMGMALGVEKSPTLEEPSDDLPAGASGGFHMHPTAPHVVYFPPPPYSSQDLDTGEATKDAIEEESEPL